MSIQMNQVTSIVAETIKTRNGKAVKVIKMRLNRYPNASERKELNAKGWHYYNAKFDLTKTDTGVVKNYTEQGYWGHLYDAKLYKAMQSKLSGAKVPEKAVKKTAKKEAKVTKYGYTVEELAMMAGLA